MPETFAASEEQRNDSAFDKEKGIATTCWVKQGRTPHPLCVLSILTLSNNKSSVQIFRRFV